MNNNDYHQQNTTCTLLYIQKANIYMKPINMYTKIETLFKNQDNLRYIFIKKNSDTLSYAIFHFKN